MTPRDHEPTNRELLQHLHDHIRAMGKDQAAQAEQLHKIRQEQAAQGLLLRRAFRKVGKIMATVEEVNAKIDAASEKLTANTNALDGIEDFLAAMNTELVAVKKQLQDLIDAGNSPPELTEVGAKLDALIGGLDAQAVKTAAVTNTPEDPND